jgi:hypothetical protein
MMTLFDSAGESFSKSLNELSNLPGSPPGRARASTNGDRQADAGKVGGYEVGGG